MTNKDRIVTVTAGADRGQPKLHEAHAGSDTLFIARKMESRQAAPALRENPLRATKGVFTC